MDIWIGFAVAALKAGVSGAVRNGIVQALADQGINIGSDKLRRYLEKSQKELSQVLTDKSLLDMKVPKEYIAYVKEEIKELIQSISLDEDLFRECRYDTNSLAEALYEKYKREKKDYVEYEGEIQKVLYVMSKKAISLEIESDGFTANSLVHIMETEDEQMELLRKIFHILDVFMKTRVTNSENDKGLERKKRLPDWTEEYRRKWDENMGLNDFNEGDDNLDVDISVYNFTFDLEIDNSSGNVSVLTKNRLREWYFNSRYKNFTVCINDKRQMKLQENLKKLNIKIHEQKVLTSEEEKEYELYTRALQMCKHESLLKQKAIEFFLKDQYLWAILCMNNYLQLLEFVKEILNYDYFNQDRYNNKQNVMLDIYLTPKPKECNDHFIVCIEKKKLDELFGGHSVYDIFGADLIDFDKKTRREIAVAFYMFLAEEVIRLKNENIIQNKKVLNLLEYRVGGH